MFGPTLLTCRDDSSLILRSGCSNVLAVLVDATAPDGWWYDGGGIYRHVWRTTTSPAPLQQKLKNCAVETFGRDPCRCMSSPGASMRLPKLLVPKVSIMAMLKFTRSLSWWTSSRTRRPFALLAPSVRWMVNSSPTRTELPALTSRSNEIEGMDFGMLSMILVLFGLLSG